MHTHSYAYTQILVQNTYKHAHIYTNTFIHALIHTHTYIHTLIYTQAISLKSHDYDEYLFQ